MDSSRATKKLFHVVVVVGMGASLAASGCSSDSTTSGPLADAAMMDSAVAGNDAAQPQMDAAQGTDSASPVDATQGMDSAQPQMDASVDADACVGWSFCC
jgi:hypothetical protein